MSERLRTEHLPSLPERSRHGPSISDFTTLEQEDKQIFEDNNWLCPKTPINLIGALLFQDQQNQGAFDKTVVGGRHEFSEPPTSIIPNVTIQTDPLISDGEPRTKIIGQVDKVLFKIIPGAYSGVVLTGIYSGLILNQLDLDSNNNPTASIDRVWNNSQIVNPYNGSTELYYRVMKGTDPLSKSVNIKLREEYKKITDPYKFPNLTTLDLFIQLYNRVYDDNLRPDAFNYTSLD